MLILTALISIVVIFAVWNLALKLILTIVLSGVFDPTDYAVFQALFGMIFTVLIALEFQRSLLVVGGRQQSVQVRTVLLIALLAIVRKLLIFDFATTEAMHLFALASAILALGGVYWLVRDQDRPERPASTSNAKAPG